MLTLILSGAFVLLQSSHACRLLPLVVKVVG